MPQSIRHLIALPELRSRLLSGAGGLDRPVRWAHVCELDDPTEWLGEGDLLMTTGLGIPSEAERQRRYVRRLAEAGLAGMMIGENMEAPSDLDALRETAEALGFPLILTHYGVPFAAVTRAIVDAGQKDEYERRNALARIYESARLSMQGLGLPALLQRLGKDVRSSLYLIVPDTLAAWQPGLPGLPVELADALRNRRREQAEPQPMVLRHPLAEGEALSIGIPSDRNCLLIALGERLPDYSLLHHLTAVLGIEIERLRVESERHLRLGSELLDDLLQRRLYREQAEERLEELLPGLDLDDAVVSVASSEGLATDPIGLFRGHDSRLLVRAQGQEIILLHQAGLASTLQEALDSSLGVSAPLRRAERCAEALREARLALAHSHSRRPLCRYAELDDEAPWLPRSLAEAERAFRLVLGALHDYDAANGSALLYTLQVFLEENRSWLNAAQRLHIHKQSLVYRIRRIEEISGRSLDSTADVATLWFALQATRLSPEARGRTAKSSLLEQSAHHGGDMD
ncbi:TPA: PucR family transcriptional regulator [Pseudomonas aeruginosa]|nr:MULTISPECIES: PucR family transcriptional regulator [Pseudomonas]APB65790.1 regulator [Pseudomonas aeruginosa]ARI92089.1 PucR family transcriptional regulator [Pseudomonas aeruginosa]ARI98527.1 PucR family transcriptional regulator [Pseudomonas aeruginosa]ASA16294.1 PucR family transcriptional regulator [Pseudomonas aeruginosa]AVK20237.1 purine catabolism regulatory protein-like family protein [Pseudomonas aeruginosa]